MHHRHHHTFAAVLTHAQPHNCERPCRQVCTSLPRSLLRHSNHHPCSDSVHQTADTILQIG